jgi:hypothetical protein
MTSGGRGQREGERARAGAGDAGPGAVLGRASAGASGRAWARAGRSAGLSRRKGRESARVCFYFSFSKV